MSEEKRDLKQQEEEESPEEEYEQETESRFFLYPVYFVLISETIPYSYNCQNDWNVHVTETYTMYIIFVMHVFSMKKCKMGVI